MRRRRHLILGTVCLVAVGFSALLLLQRGSVVRPFGIGWGDASVGRAYSVEADGAIVMRTAAGMKAPPTGNYPYAVDSLARWGRAGVSYHRWNMTAGRGPGAPVLGTYAEVRIGAGWPMLVALVGAVSWYMLRSRDKRLARAAGRCANCGYDLRATPNRCPECGVAAMGSRVV